MARLFDDDLSQYLERGTPIVSGYPLTISVWFKVPSGNSVAFLSANQRSSWNRVTLYATNTDTLRYHLRHSASPYDLVIESTNTFTANTWQHALGMSWTSSSHISVLNGDEVNRGISTTSWTFPESLSNAQIGTNYSNSTLYTLLDGAVAEIAVWNVALVLGERQALANGFSPLCVRRSGLIFYAPLGGALSNDNAANNSYGDRDITKVTGSMTPVNSPGVTDHPPIIYPGWSMVVLAIGEAGGGVDIPIAQHHYKMLASN